MRIEFAVLITGILCAAFSTVSRAASPTDTVYPPYDGTFILTDGPTGPGDNFILTRTLPTGGFRAETANLLQFASATDLGNAVSGLNGTIAALNASLNASIDNVLQQVWIGTALAAALTPVLPQDGKSNELNYATSTAGGKVAVSVNYSHVEGNLNFTAAAAYSRKYALAKIGMGVSW